MNDTIDVEVEEIPDNKLQTVETGVVIFDKDPVKAFAEMERIVQSIANKLKGEDFISIVKGNPYPKVEWWTTIGASLGLFPITEWSKRCEREDEIAYESRVSVRKNGQIVTVGEAFCSNLEDGKTDQDEHAIKSMSITRATSKAFRIGLPMLAVMAGLKPTPAEEVPKEGFDNSPPSYGNDDTDEEWTGEEFCKAKKMKWSAVAGKDVQWLSDNHDTKYGDNLAQFELDRRVKDSKSTDTTTNYDFLKSIRELKTKLDQDAKYYQILQMMGYKKSSEITKRDDQKKLYETLKNLVEA